MVEQDGVPFIVSHMDAAALAQKPKRDATDYSKKDKAKAKPKGPYNPFAEGNLDRRLLVIDAHGPDDDSDDEAVAGTLFPRRRHRLLLNKFPVVDDHALLVTRDVEPQTDPLNADDLAAAWARV